MKNRNLTVLTVFALTAIMLLTVAQALTYVDGERQVSLNKGSVSFRLGVTFGGNTTEEAKLLIDKVKTYTNLFVLQSGSVSKDEIATTEISQYAIDAGLDLIVYFGWLDPAYPWRLPWIENAKQRWGDRLLGVYFGDEPQGAPLDFDWTSYFEKERELNSTLYQLHAEVIEHTINDIRHSLNGTYPHNYDEAAKVSVDGIQKRLAPLKGLPFKIFTSDYVLYWFGYLGGYDVMLSQFGANQSIIQDIALIRGAARLQNKTWGAIITWKYNAPPYLDSGEEIYRQLVTAYEAGASYGILFNYPQIEGNAYGILTEEHFKAIEKFWKDLLTKAKNGNIQNSAEAVLILPRNYGWGMRRTDDRIWGFWGPDDKSVQIWKNIRELIFQYGSRLDIVYDDPEFPTAGKYPYTYFWNQTVEPQKANLLSSEHLHNIMKDSTYVTPPPEHSNDMTHNGEQVQNC